MGLELKVGDVLRMKKPHPCGHHLWLVTRLGADIGVTCQGCRRHLMLARSLMKRWVKEVIPEIREPLDSGDAVTNNS